jgi:hypothetical protein
MGSESGAALAGVDRLLLVSSSEVGHLAAQHTNVIAAARAAGISRILYTSMLNAYHDLSRGGEGSTHIGSGQGYLPHFEAVQAAGLPRYPSHGQPRKGVRRRHCTARIAGRAVAEQHFSFQPPVCSIDVLITSLEDLHLFVAAR